LGGQEHEDASVRFYRDVLDVEMPYCGESVLRGADVWIDANVPGIKQPFWDVASIPVPLAPAAKLIR
jgi:hypothetical protein